jgi:hypothetical protein
MNSIVHVRPEAVPFEQTTATAPAEEPADLDTELDRLDSALATLDELTARQREFPRHIAEIDARCEALVSSSLDSLEAIQSRSAEMSKLGAMRELGQVRQKKLSAAIGAEQEAAIRLGMRIAGLLEAKWWKLYTKRAHEIRAKFDELFYRSGLDPNLGDAYKPIVALKWMQVPSFNASRFSPPDTKIAKCRQLREAAAKLREFESMSFEEIVARVDEMDRKSRERLRTGTGN